MSESVTTVEAAVKFALAQVGKPYKWGAVGPNSFDCSGLLWRAYQAGGIDITRSTGTQKLRGSEVAGDWLPGDLLFSHSAASPSGNHVKMYIGGGRVVEAPRTGLNVRVADAPAKSELNSVRRYVKTQQTAYQPTYQKAGFGLDDVGGILGSAAGSVAGPLGSVVGGLIGGAGGVAGGIAGGVGNTVDAAGKVIDAAAFIIDPHNWFRVGMALLGALLLFIAFRQLGPSSLNGENLKSALGSVTKSGGEAAAAAA